MKILFDQGTPVPLRKALNGHEVATAFECGWQMLQNGELLTVAQAAGFQALITTDKNLRYQQDLASRALAVLVLPTTNWRHISAHGALIADAVAALTPGAYVELIFPSS